MTARERIERKQWEAMDKANPQEGWQPCDAAQLIRWAENHGETAETLATAGIDERRTIHGEFAEYRVVGV